MPYPSQGFQAAASALLSTVSAAPSLHDFLEERKIPEAAFVKDALSNMDINDMASMKKKYTDEYDVFRSVFMSLEGITPMQWSKLDRALSDLTLNENYKRKLDERNRNLDGNQLPQVSRKPTANLEEDKAAVRDPENLIAKFMDEYPDYPGVSLSDARDVASKVEGMVQSLIRRQDRKIAEVVQSRQAFELVFELLTWIGASERGTLGDGVEDNLVELRSKLKEFPRVRQCFHALREGDVQHVREFVTDFRELCNVVWVPDRTTLLFGVISSRSATQQEKRGLVGWLLEQSANVGQHKPGAVAPTPLHAAVETHDADLVRLLLDNGADTEARTAFGLTADQAYGQGHSAFVPKPEIVDMIEERRRRLFPELGWVWEVSPLGGFSGHREWKSLESMGPEVMNQFFDFGKKLSVAYSQKSSDFISNNADPTRRQNLASASLQTWQVCWQLNDGTSETYYHLRLQSLVLPPPEKARWEMLLDEQEGEWTEMEELLATKCNRGDSFDDDQPGRKLVFERIGAGYDVYEYPSGRRFFARCRPHWTFPMPTVPLGPTPEDLPMPPMTPSPLPVQPEPVILDEPEPFVPNVGVFRDRSVEELLMEEREKARTQKAKLEGELAKANDEQNKNKREREQLEAEKQHWQDNANKNFNRLQDLIRKDTLLTQEVEKLQRKVEKANEEAQHASENIDQAKQRETVANREKEALQNEKKKLDAALAEKEQDICRTKEKADLLQREYDKADGERKKLLGELHTEMTEKAKLLNREKELAERKRSLQVRTYSMPERLEELGMIELVLNGTLREALGKQETDFADLLLVTLDVPTRTLTVTGPQKILHVMSSIEKSLYSLSKRFTRFGCDVNKAAQKFVKRLSWQLTKELTEHHLPLAIAYQRMYEKALNEWIGPVSDQCAQDGQKAARAEARKLVFNPWDKDSYSIFDKKINSLVSEMQKASPEKGFKMRVLSSLLRSESSSLREGIPERVQQNLDKQGIEDEGVRRKIQRQLEARYKDCALAFDRNRERLVAEMSNSFQGKYLLKFHVHLEMAKLGLPIYIQSNEMITTLKDPSVDVLQVKCATGSGKSTVLPMLLMAEFEERICVTQPRILPCVRTCEFASSIVGNDLVGAEWAGQKINAAARLVYVTDGLISARVVGPDMLASQPFRVIAFDEVHERSSNIDIALFGIARTVRQLKNDGKSPIKIVVMSATLDPDCMIPFNRFGLAHRSTEVEVPSPFAVELDNAYRGQHFLTATLDLYRRRTRPDDQILCFLPGEAEVRDAVGAFQEATGLPAVGLTARVDPGVVQQSLKSGSVFFSTNVAETSLTFPRLAVVVDLGKRKVARFQRGIFRLQEDTAPRSTVQQRKGRCGRVRNGAYCPLYHDRDITEDFAQPALLTADVMDVEFRLWCATGSGMQAISDKLPIAGQDGKLLDRQTQDVRFLAEQLGMVTGSNFTSVGEDMKLLPEVGGMRWRRALVAGMRAGVGEDVLQVCAAFTALPNVKSWIFKAIPAAHADADGGDLSTLYRYMREVSQCVEKDKVEARSKGKPFDFSTVGDNLMSLVKSCGAGPAGPKHMWSLTLKMAKEYHKLQEKITAAMQRARHRNDVDTCAFLSLAFVTKSTVASPTKVLEAIFAGFLDRAAVSQKLIGGRTGHYTLLYKQLESDAGMGELNLTQYHATIDSKSMLARKAQEVMDYVFSVELSHLAPSETSPVMLGVVSKCLAGWLEDKPKCKVFAEISESEWPKPVIAAAFKKRIFQKVNGRVLEAGMGMGEFEGTPHKAVEALRTLATSDTLLQEGARFLQPPPNLNGKLDKTTLERNLQHYQQNLGVFSQWLNTWKNVAQVEITMKARRPQGVTMPEDIFPELDERKLPWFKWKAREHHSSKIAKAVELAGKYIALCSAANATKVDFFEKSKDPKHEMLGAEKPSIVLGEMSKLPVRITPQGEKWDALRERIAQCCDSSRSTSELWSQIHGPNATRPQRMAAVAHVAITKYDLRLKGGFIRDWVVAGRDEKPKSCSPTDKEFWQVPLKGFLGRPEIHEEFLPQDLDLQFHGPGHKWFDVQRFKSDVESIGIQVTHVHEDAMLIILVFDSFEGSLGPFTAELVLPHVAPTMVDIDFDCNNLCLEVDYPKDISMRIAHLGLTIPSIIRRIMDKEFYVCKERSPLIKRRIEKMEGRGWKDVGDKIWVAGTEEGFVRLPVEWTGGKALEVVNALRHDVPGATIVRVFQLKNNSLTNLYNAEKSHIEKNDKNEANEKELWHGAPNEPNVKDGIAALGIDNRFWTPGMFGFGGYFAEQPRKSHFFCKKYSTRLMFYCKVLTGRAEELQGEQGHPPHPGGHRDRKAPAEGHNCIKGVGHAPDATVDEYVIFKPQQALPLYQIEYTGGD